MMLCERLDIWCAYLCGPTTTEPERSNASDEGSGNRPAWNLLYLDGIYTQIDATWDLCDENSGYATHTYFGMSNVMAACTRETDPDIICPVCPEPNAANWYIRNRCCFKSREKLEAFLLDRVKHGITHLEFRFDAMGDPNVSSQTIADWVSAFLQNRASKWQWIYRESMLTFSYHITYQTNTEKMNLLCGENTSER